MPPWSGDRPIWSDGARYVVEEVWRSFEKHGGLPLGHHVLLREATTDEERPQRVDPSCFIAPASRGSAVRPIPGHRHRPRSPAQVTV